MPITGFSARGRVFAAVAFLVCFGSSAGAQSILDARRVEFSPSPDHAVVDSSGVPLVDGYTMNIFPAGGATPLETVDLGKPAPDADGFIRVDFIALLPVPLTPGLSYEATVSADGPGGSSASGRSNTFGLSTPCSYSISPNGQTFAAAGGAGSFSVTTDAACNWTAVSNDPWLTVTSGATGAGPGTVAFSVAVNDAAASRSGTLLAAGWNFTVVQGGADCTFAVSPTAISTGYTATTLSVTVSTAPGCAWTASSPASWAVVSSGASGNGPGTVTLTVSRDNWANRSATLTIAGQSVVLTQQGRPRRR